MTNQQNKDWSHDIGNKLGVGGVLLALLGFGILYFSASAIALWIIAAGFLITFVGGIRLTMLYMKSLGRNKK